MIGQRFHEILVFWWRNLAPLFLVSAPFALLIEASQWLLGPAFVAPEEPGQPMTFGAGLILVLLLRPLAEGTLISQLAAIHGGKPAGLLACMAPALLSYPLLLATYAIMSVGVGLGLLAFLFPALWVYTRLCFAPFLVLLGKENPIDALRRSFLMTQEQQWSLLMLLVMSFLFYLMASALIASAVLSVVTHPAAAALLVAIPVSLLGTLVNVAVFRFYTLAREGQ